MILLNDLQVLQIVLSGAVATSQPHFYAGYVDLASGILSTPAPVTGTTNSTTAVTWVAAPAASTVRQVKALSLYNADTSSVTATVRVNDNGTNRTLRVVTLLPGQSLEYVDTAGWSVADSAQSPTSVGYIDGLRLLYVSANAVTADSGSAYIQGLARRVDVSTAIAKSSLSLSASTWYHVYLFESAGVADIEIVTTAPAAAYNGTARSKTGDTSRRYLGSVRTDGSGNILAFTHYGNRIAYDAGGSGTLRPLANGNATSDTAVSLASYVPVTTTVATLLLSTNSSTAYFQVKKAVAAAIYFTIGPSVNSSDVALIVIDIPAPGQAIAYVGQSSSAAAYIDVLGYVLER
ncbi:hypothetical protein [Lysobacter antibioticus]|uniref:Uncharacterized protein n=1 Tax=Lysobacter antibioticus TaxID=84531 RepID=A0A0S2F7L9_LYSAN|nr:hypothetical protein [Lysobacter antibioticus]ALN79515.1 hypothetical protein LA76x_1358 [Lysobacter antibioticus]